MSDMADFLAYCIEEYKAAEHLNGKTVIELFRQYDILQYISDNYGALHTTGAQYIVEDINKCIAARRNHNEWAV